MADQNPDLESNPLLANTGLPRFDEIEATHVVPAIRHVLAEAERQLSELEENIEPTWDGLMQPLEAIDRPFEYAWKPVTHLFGVLNSADLREAYETVLGEVVQFSMRAKQSRPIYEALKAIKSGEQWHSLSEARQRIVDARLLDAELAGIGLEGTQQKRFNEIAQALSQMGTDFSNHVLDATKAFALDLTEPDEVAGLPPSLLQLAAQSYNTAHAGDADDGGDAHGDRGESAETPQATAEAGPWRISLEAPSLMPFLQHSQRRDLREQVYRAFITRASEGEFDNSPLIPRTLKLRQEMANLLGYASYAEVSLAEKMAPDVAAVQEVFAELRAASWEPAKQDMSELTQLAAESGFAEPLKHWDVGYWAERLREKKFDYTDEEIRPYFSQDRVLEGLFGLLNRLFGITVTQADSDVPVWHPDARFYNIADESGTHIASFYLDPYSRPENKRGGAWMDTCLSRRWIGDRLQLPVAHLVCNSTPTVGETPSLMTFREVETLFHEFGHGLQHMLTTVDEADAAGISGVEWDAVELPSQFMENWCYHKPTLLGISGHYQTGESLPDDLFEKICAARTYRSGSMMLRQLLFGMTDIELHSTYDANADGGESVFDVQRRLSELTSVLPQLPEDRSLCSFQHIFAGGYSAGYYSYKWAEVLSADAFGAFEEAGLDDEQIVAETGRRFRDTVLALGGGRHPMQVFKDFRGREPSTDALLRHCGLTAS